MARVRFREGARRRPRLLGFHFDANGVSKEDVPLNSAALRRVGRRVVGRRLLEIVPEAVVSSLPVAPPGEPVSPLQDEPGDAFPSADKDEADEVLDLGDDEDDAEIEAQPEESAEDESEPTPARPQARKRGRPRKNR